ncbi:malonic semialdehyde reductase [Rhodothalassium salexigens DSM 2132]|nr:malonic semialdehyde reductase [Rhodothalassium salexigens]MBK1639998.1 malonic semialdehyde reductase [Rhodothalassium salexigens DSM 2132]
MPPKKDRPVPEQLSEQALDTLFRDARTYNNWLDKDIEEDTLHRLYDLLKWGPTSANCSPARFLFCRSVEAKARLAGHAMATNAEKIRKAPVTVIVAQHPRFYDWIPELFPHNPDAREWFAPNPDLAETTMFRNATLQGAYLIVAARALGLDCGPMSGFDNAAVDADFFADSEWRSNFLCSIGYGDPESIFPRHPRLDFDQACSVL